jgi:hypothetical protein
MAIRRLVLRRRGCSMQTATVTVNVTRQRIAEIK